MDLEYTIEANETGRVVTGQGIAESLPRRLAELGGDAVFFLVDAAVAEKARPLAEALEAPVLVVSGGEALKTWSGIETRAEELLELGATRRSLLVAMGGGATTDFGAFLASVYMRGMRCALLPTTLLGMVDAALGGKNGVDLGPHKNLLGAIRQPGLVAADVAWLDTLDDARMAEGLVEIIKKAGMLDAEVFGAIADDLDRLLARDPAALAAAVDAAVAMKLGVVQGDAREAGRRMLLNFGHTVGHAFEALSDFALSHGAAVARGMLVECRMIDSEITDRLAAILDRLPLAGETPSADVEAIWELMKRDKKNSRGVVRIAAPRTLGRGEVFEVDRDALRRAL